MWLEILRVGYFKCTYRQKYIHHFLKKWSNAWNWEIWKEVRSVHSPPKNDAAATRGFQPAWTPSFGRQTGVGSRKQSASAREVLRTCRKAPVMSKSRQKIVIWSNHSWTIIDNIRPTLKQFSLNQANWKITCTGICVKILMRYFHNLASAIFYVQLMKGPFHKDPALPKEILRLRWSNKQSTSEGRLSNSGCLFGHL